MKELTHDKKLEALNFVERSLEEPKELECNPYICTLFLFLIDKMLKKYNVKDIRFVFPELYIAIDRLQMAENGINYDIYKPIWPKGFTQERIELIKQVRAELLDDGEPF